MVARSLALLTLFIGMALPAAAQAPAALVQVDAVKRETTGQAVRLVGQVVPNHAGAIAARTLGVVVDGPLPVGSSVRQGDVILTLDGLTQAANLAEARAALAQAQTELTLAESQLQRARKLESTRAVDQATIDQRTQEALSAKARLDKARVDLERAKTDSGYVTVKAPFDGVVTAHQTNLGAWVNRGDTVVQMVSSAQLWIELGVPSHIARDGLPQTLHWESDSGSHGEATVFALLPAENPRARTRTLRARPTTVSGLLPYAPVTVEVRAAQEQTQLSVHKDAIVRTLDGPMVYLAADGKAEPRQVTLGSSVGSRIIVTEGLNEGDLVIVRGNERLRPDQSIRYPNAG